MNHLRNILTVTALAAVLPGLLSAQQPPRSLEFSGYTWEVRRSSGLEGPGPNRFLDNRRTVWLDESGGLHLKVWQRLGVAYAAEVILGTTLGYGTYIVQTMGALDHMDPSVIFGMFTYDHNPDYHHREIDIEYGRFGDPDGPNAQFVVQPFDLSANRHRFTVSQEGDYLTHAIWWRPEGIIFASYHGHVADELAGRETIETDDPRVIACWGYGGSVPPPGNERFRMNLWLYESVFPEEDHEIVIASFAFHPNCLEDCP